MRCKGVSATLAALLIFGATHATTAYAQAEQAAQSTINSLSLVPSANLDLAQLQRWIREHAPEVEESALTASLAHAELTKSRVLPNPTLDAGWGTVPIGQTNPANLSQRFVHIPNYSVGLSYTVPIGKRGPLMERARAIESMTEQTLAADIRSRALLCAQLLGALATTTLRIEGLRELVEMSRSLTRVAKVQVQAQALAGLDLDRSELDLSRLEHSVQAAESEKEAILTACMNIAGTRCSAFSGAVEAREFLKKWIDSIPHADSFDARPDLLALRAQADVAEKERKWAHSLRIPDPTIRIGYLRDQFIISGSQQNSLNLSVSVPLTFFDHGQAETEAALAKSEHASAQYNKRIALTQQRLPSLHAQLSELIQHQHALEEQLLPKARSVLLELTSAADKRLVSISDVILARRAVSDVLVDEANSLGATFAMALELMSELTNSNNK